MVRPGWRASGVVLVVVLALLGHDAAMAGRAHGQPGASHLAVPRGAAQSAAQAPEAEPGPADHDPSSDVPDDCGVVRPVVPKADDPGLSAPAADAIALPLGDRAAPSASPWSEPTRPPGTRRALVQVYRI